MWILFLLTFGYSVHAQISDPTIIHVKVGNQPVNLTSPGFPTHNYPPNLNRQYKISTDTPVNTALKMIIENLHLDPTCDDYLQIIEFNRLIYTFCGIMSFRTPFYFTSSRLLLIFRTNSEHNFRGFQLTFERTSEIPYYPLGRCGYQQMATSQDQNLYSPLAPYPYPNNVACIWTIAARRNYCIHATIVKFRTKAQDNLVIESGDQNPLIFNGTNHIPPIILPLFCPIVYLRFTARSPEVEQGFQIVYREHPSPNTVYGQLASLANLEKQISLVLSPNTTSFSKIFHQLDTITAGNLLTANQLEYVQSQLNDRLEEFSYQLNTHVKNVANTSYAARNCNLTAYTPPFPYYEHVMLSLAGISILFSVFFAFLTCCLSRRLYHFYLISDKDQLKTSTHEPPRYQPGKYARTMQHIIMLALTLPTYAKPIPPPENLLLELWKHTQWEDNHGALFPFLPYRSSEALFQSIALVFLIATFTVALYPCLYSYCFPSKSGGKSPSSTHSSMKRPKSSTLRKSLSQISLITLGYCGTGAEAALAPITQGTFLHPSTPIPENMQQIPNATWEHISFDRLWERTQEDYAWTNPIPMYSKIFGYAVAEGNTFTQKYYLKSKYWNKIDVMERSCLCAREIRDIVPHLTKDALAVNIPITRQTGHLARHRWKIQMNKQPDVFVPEIWDFILPDDRTFALLAAYKQRVISLLDQYAVVQANCKTETKQATCGIYNYDCRGDITYDPNKDEPLINTNQYISENGIFWQQYWFSKNCTLTPTHRWISVCTSDDKGCLEVNPTDKNLQCCDISYALSYGKESWEYRSAYWSPCCQNGEKCHNWDTQTLWYKHKITCNIKGKEFPFEPILTDIVIQEEYDNSTAMNLIQKHLQKINNDQRKMIPLPERVKLLLPTTNDKAKAYRDGPPLLSKVQKYYYETFPSMITNDVKCNQRIKSKPECHVLVGGIYPKLAFYQQVKYDPAHNLTKFPGLPLKIFGSNGQMGNPPEHIKKRIHKRQITGGVVLFVFLTSLISNAITGITTGLTLQEEINDKLMELESRVNDRFEQDEQNIRDLSDHINSLEAVNTVQNQAIIRSLTQTLTLQTLQSTTDDFLQSEIDANRRLLLNNLGAYLKSIQTFREISTAEAELDRLILKQIQSTKGVNLFDPSKIYLTKISQGNLYLKVLAQQIANETTKLGEQITLDDKKFQEQMNKTRSWRNQTESIKKLIKIANDSIPAYINITLKKWHPANISVNFSIDDVTPSEFINSLKKGLGVIPKTVVDTVGDVITTVGKDILKPLLPYLLPALAAFVLIFGGICICKYHSKCKKRSPPDNHNNESLQRMMNPTNLRQ